MSSGHGMIGPEERNREGAVGEGRVGFSGMDSANALTVKSQKPRYRLHASRSEWQRSKGSQDQAPTSPNAPKSVESSVTA